MEKRNLPIALVYCVLTVLSIPLLIIYIFRFFSYGTIFHKICFTILGISTFLYALFNTLYHWITINKKTLKSLSKIALLSSSLIIFSVLLCYSFCTLSGAKKWIMFSFISLFFAYEQIFFSIWTKIPFFIAEIFKDINCIVIFIFFPTIIHFVYGINKLPLFIFFLIVCIILMVVSIVFKYIYTGTKKACYYTTSRILAILTLTLQIILLGLICVP